MAFESLTDGQLGVLVSCPKRAVNSNARWIAKPGHRQRNFSVEATDGSGHHFQVYQRQNTATGMEDDFSCGINWQATNGEVLILRRYNGPSHNHPNRLEGTETGYASHLHQATERYIHAGKKPEGYAEVYSGYSTVDGALHCLVRDCNISGLRTATDSNSLFSHLPSSTDTDNTP